jgi:hypothetical protein
MAAAGNVWSRLPDDPVERWLELASGKPDWCLPTDGELDAHSQEYDRQAKARRSAGIDYRARRGRGR